MKILITGAKGFFGKNLAEALKNIRDGKDRRLDIAVTDVYEYGRQSTEEELRAYCADCDFVFQYLPKCA